MWHRLLSMPKDDVERTESIVPAVTSVGKVKDCPVLVNNAAAAARFAFDEFFLGDQTAFRSHRKRDENVRPLLSEVKCSTH